MAKQRRPAPSAVRAKKKTAKAPGKGVRKAPTRVASGRTTTMRAAGGGSTATTLRAAAAPAAPPPPAPKKPGFYEAVAIYERGVQALQRHDYAAAAESFKAVLERYPEERELLERAVLYLRVCERETARQPPAPRTPAERVYAATLALNSGDQAAAHDHLQRALSEDPESDHAHYTMAVLLGMRGQVVEALGYLKNAIGLNQENRSLARQDPDLEPVRGHQNFAAVLDAPAMRRRAKPRR